MLLQNTKVQSLGDRPGDVFTRGGNVSACLGQVVQFLEHTLNLTDTAEPEMGYHDDSLTSYCNTSAVQSDKVRSGPPCEVVYSVNTL